MIGILSLVSIFIAWKQLDRQPFQVTTSKYDNSKNFNTTTNATVTNSPSKDELKAIDIDSGIDWVRPSPLEIQQLQASNQKSCKNPFQHCCLGQCRQEKLQIDPNESFWKPVFRDNNSSPRQQRPLKTILDVLDYYGSTVHKNNSSSSSSTSPCTIVFGGDSMSSDHTMDVVCRLIEDGYELKSCHPAIGGALYGADVNVTCPQNKYPDRPHFLLEHNDPNTLRTCPEVLIGSTYECPSKSIRKWFQEPPPTISENDWGGLVIFNWGARCKTKQDIESCLFQELEPYLQLAKDATMGQKWKFIYRETEPQHFNIDGGLYYSRWKENATFFECSRFQGSADNFRNQVALQLLEQHNLSKSIPVIPLFSALEPLTQLHFQGEDCTHYCYDPMRFWITWEGLYNVLVKTGNNNF